LAIQNRKITIIFKKIPMNFGVVLLSLVLPFQVSIFSAEKERASPFWAVHVAIDTSRLIGLASMRGKEPIYNLDPELLVRLPIKEDRPKNRRKQFIENYVKTTALIVSR
jgi:hypothetical protein